MRLVTLGDLLLDVVVALELPLVAGDDTPARTRMGAGGQAANVAAWGSLLGAESRFVGKRGDDTTAALLTSELEGRGVTLSGPAEGASGIVVSISCAGERSLASDRGSAPGLRPEELEAGWFDCDHLHLSGYALAAEPIATAAARAVELARAHAATLSVDLSSPALIDRPFRRLVSSLAPEIVFATERERERFGPLPGRAVVKRGAAGVSVEGVEHPSVAADVRDPTGAGDAFAAGFLVGGVELGLESAARCCARLGSLP